MMRVKGKQIKQSQITFTEPFNIRNSVKQYLKHTSGEKAQDIDFILEQLCNYKSYRYLFKYKRHGCLLSRDLRKPLKEESATNEGKIGENVITNAVKLQVHVTAKQTLKLELNQQAKIIYPEKIKIKRKSRKREDREKTER